MFKPSLKIEKRENRLLYSKFQTTYGSSVCTITMDFISVGILSLIRNPSHFFFGINNSTIHDTLYPCHPYLHKKQGKHAFKSVFKKLKIISCPLSSRLNPIAKLCKFNTISFFTAYKMLHRKRFVLLFLLDCFCFFHDCF